MLRFKILNGFHAGKEAGHAVREYDTTLEQDVQTAEAEFNRLLQEGRSAVTEDGTRVTEMPNDGVVYFLLQMEGG